MEIIELNRKSIQYRKQILEIINTSNSGHIGGCLSCIDILNVLYNHVMDITPGSCISCDRDRYVHSKGHAVEALYVVLADKGFFDFEDLKSKEKFGSKFIGHPTRNVPGIEFNTGSLGHGLSAAVGMAIAAKLDSKPIRVFTLLGDGELAEGSVWEASMCANHYRLNNLTVIIDRNGLQITGNTEQVMGLEPLEAKFKAFGYSVQTIDGNNIEELIQAFNNISKNSKKPNLILANTIKGKGISFMENECVWHHRVPSYDEYIKALEEIDQYQMNHFEKFNEPIS